MTRDRHHEPLRTCVGCRRRAPARTLVRIFRRADGTIDVGRGDGRGAWVCAPRQGGRACLDEAAKRGALARALRGTVSNADVVHLRARLDGRSVT